jgi:hypothetical protein
MSKKSIDERLKAHPILQNRIEAILDIVEEVLLPINSFAITRLLLAKVWWFSVNLTFGYCKIGDCRLNTGLQSV